jgi:hypothetical protein
MESGRSTGAPVQRAVPDAQPIARFTQGMLEAPSGFEPEMEVLQTSALPLGYGAEGGSDFDSTERNAKVKSTGNAPVARFPRSGTAGSRH